MFHVKKRNDMLTCQITGKTPLPTAARACITVLVLFLSLATGAGSALAQEQPQTKAESVRQQDDAKTSGNQEQETLELLLTLQDSLEQKRTQLQALRLELRVADTEEEKAALEKRIEGLQQELEDTIKDFNHLAAGEELEKFEQTQQEQFTLDQQLKVILEPLLRELSDLTRRPREIDTLRTRIEFAEERLPLVKTILARLEKLMRDTDDLELRQQLEEVRKRWAQTRNDLENELQLANYKLKQVLDERRSISGTIGKLLESFIKTRGVNLVIALVAFLVVYFALRWAKAVLFTLPRLKKLESKSFLLRLFNLGFAFLAVALAGFAALGTLYAAGDWLLLVIFFVLFVSLAWSARAGLLQFWEEIKLILNIGGVREGERIIYRDIPWRVLRLNYYTRLENPELSGGGIRVRLKDLVEHVSRPFAPDEPWFPTRKGDWVLLEDGVYGKVAQQNPDMVRLWLYGNSFKTYSTSSYTSLNPKVISTGFLIRSDFGVDYRHQDIATTEMPEAFEAAIRSRLEEAGRIDQLQGLTVDFLEAGASSLNLVVFASFSGDAADSYFTFGRLIQKACVETCTERGWTIPFPQLTVHTQSA